MLWCLIESFWPSHVKSVAGQAARVSKRFVHRTSPQRRSFPPQHVDTWHTNASKSCLPKMTTVTKGKGEKTTRWSPPTRMPRRMLRNRNNTYLSHFPANPLVGHPDLTHWGDTLVGHPCLTLLRNALVSHSCLTLLFDTFVGHSCLTLFFDTLVRQCCLTLLTRHSCLALFLRHSYLTLF